MKKYLFLILIVLTSLMVSCRHKHEFIDGYCECGVAKYEKGTGDGINLNSSYFNVYSNTARSDTPVSDQLQKGTITEKGIYCGYIDNSLNTNLNSTGEFFESILNNIGESFATILGTNETGKILVVKSAEISNCIVWIDQWTNSINVGDTVISESTEIILNPEIQNNLSLEYKGFEISLSSVKQSTEKYIKNNTRTYSYNLEGYDIENYEYAWSLNCNMIVYEYMYYRWRFLGFLPGIPQYEYVKSEFVVNINEDNPDWERKLLYRAN